MPNTLHKILLIEDSQPTRELLIRLLGGAKKCFHGEVKVIQADNWDDGARYVEEGSIDVVLLDLSLPPSGRDETSMKYAAVATVWPPTLVITGVESDDMRKRCIGFGASDYIDKDLAVRGLPDSLMERIYNAWLRRRYYAS